GARLAQTLHLDSTIELLPQDPVLLPVVLVSTNAALDSLVSKALSQRPELRQNRAVVAAARAAEKGAVYGPLIPSVGAQVFAGGLGGGGATTSGFGESEDYMVTLGWRLGPGGLFDRGRIQATQSRLRIARLDQAKLLDEVTRQVVETQTRLHSQG